MGLTPLAVILRPPNVFNPNRVSSPQKKRTFPLQPNVLNANHTSIAKFSPKFFYMLRVAQTTAPRSQVSALSVTIASDNAPVYAPFCTWPQSPTPAPTNHRSLDTHQSLAFPLSVSAILALPKLVLHAVALKTLCA